MWHVQIVNVMAVPGLVLSAIALATRLQERCGPAGTEAADINVIKTTPPAMIIIAVT